jgi:hypothetical protein
MNTTIPTQADNQIQQELQDLKNRIDEIGDTITAFMDEMRNLTEPLVKKKMNDANKPSHQLSRRIKLLAVEAGYTGIKGQEENAKVWDLKGRLSAPLFELLKAEYCIEKFSTEGIKGFVEDHGIRPEKQPEPKTKKKSAA